ncbi:exonuclease domain-containing protein [Cellulosimicrobium sp. XJ-DQ-B-000]|uniref:exonuclease domain-containing protein n=1 Tax=Cellulosimicrobium sp. XJ-DQ-B-000 TaxID=3072182 RepID=UPI002808BEBB|nr:exonuclease domain-containing protein [Cellulosimicrobium sp. XJ-DQ-B-000]MDQ8040977.1 exonuclease domain-containing protein [Cellulosimicrobium sp. XJ-DQ-B-000]
MTTTPWTAGPLLGLDTETTGLDVDVDRVVTAALVLREPGATHVRTWLLDPGVEIPAEATGIHGITTAHATAHGSAPAVALDEIATLVVDAQRDGVPLVAYNAAFDLAILDTELVRHGLPTLAARLGRPVRPVLDPLVLDRAWDPAREGKRRLVDLCARYEVLDVGPLHTADGDVLATLDLLDALARAYPDLAGLGPVALHDLQVVAHRQWVDALDPDPDQPYVGAGADGRWPG